MSHAEKAETTSPATPARGPVRTALTAALGYLSGAMVKMIPVLLVCGMFKTAQTLIGPSMLGLANMLAVGTDSFVLVGAGVAIWAAFGMALGGFLRQRGTAEAGEALGYFVPGIVGGGALNTLNAGISDLLAMGVAAAVTYATWRDANAPIRR